MHVDKCQSVRGVFGACMTCVLPADGQALVPGVRGDNGDKVLPIKKARTTNCNSKVCTLVLVCSVSGRFAASPGIAAVA